MTNATAVSRALSAAGIERAGKYSPWGYDTDGFIAMNAFDRSSVTVMFTLKHERGRVMCERARAALEQRGFTVTERGRNGVGGDYTLTVTKET